MLQKLKKRRGIFMLGIGLLILILVIPMLLRDGGDAQARESVHEATAEIGTIATTVTATGNLETVSAETIRIPAGLTVEDVFVSAGDLVSAGDPLAAFDLASVQTRLAETQEEINDLDREIERTRNDTEPTRITTAVSGRVKAIFAEAGDPVVGAMLAHDALLLLSLDGRMAVEFEAGAPIHLHPDLTAEVTVTLSDGTEHRGMVERRAGGMPTVTLTDNGPRFGDTVTVTYGDTALGSGTLVINQPLAITATSGRVERVHIAENAQVRAGATLFTLEEVDASSAYVALLAERAEQAEVLRNLIALSQTGVLTANFDGIVENVFIGDGGGASGGQQAPSFPGGLPGGWVGLMRNTDSLDLGITRLSGVEIEALLDPEVPLDPEIPMPTVPPVPDFQMIETLADLQLAPPVLGGTPQTSIQGMNYTGTVQWIPETPVFLPATEYRAAITLTAVDGFLFGQGVVTELEEGNFPTPGATVMGAQLMGNALAVAVAFSATAELPNGGFPGMPEMPQFPSFPSFPSMGGFAMPSMDASAMAGMGTAGSSDIQTPAFTIAAGEMMQLVVSVDERDILSLEVGQRAEITLEAAVYEVFTGELTRINVSGSAGSGGTRYQVEITLPRTDQMLPGMSASAVITTYEVSDILIIPAEALSEEWPRVFVYTELVSGVPGNPVDVVTGLSDGLYVEIQSGLAPGDVVYFIVIDTPRWPQWGMGPGPFGGGGGN